MNYTVSERDMKVTLIAYLEGEGKAELAAIIANSDMVYDPRWEFSGVVSNQRKLYLSIRVPVAYKKIIEQEKEYLSKLTSDIYQDDEDYYFIGVSNVGVKPIVTTEVEYDNKYIIVDKNSVYSDVISFLVNSDNLCELQKKYLFEACNCGANRDFFAASVMLGALAELMLLDLCGAFEKYLEKHKESDAELDAYRRKVINARCANDRLNEFLKRVISNEYLRRSDRCEEAGIDDGTLRQNPCVNGRGVV